MTPPRFLLRTPAQVGVFISYPRAPERLFLFWVGVPLGQLLLFHPVAPSPFLRLPWRPRWGRVTRMCGASRHTRLFFILQGEQSDLNFAFWQSAFLHQRPERPKGALMHSANAVRQRGKPLWKPLRKKQHMPPLAKMFGMQNPWKRKKVQVLLLYSDFSYSPVANCVY